MPNQTHQADYSTQSNRLNKYAPAVIFVLTIFGCLIYAAANILNDISTSENSQLTFLPYVLLGLALIIALGFEFVNGFHDTANAVATVIYTHSLPANVAVLLSGLCNFLGVLVSTGAISYTILSLLPVELILQEGSKNGFSMVFALLLSAILWNLGTWLLGLPASSSHTMIGSIIGVGITNAWMHGHQTGGVDWAQAQEVGYSLLISPLIGFGFAAILMIMARILIKNESLYQSPVNNQPPPTWIRSLLILTCSGVSFAHGSNDGQKGMGLIMLILVGTVPMAYALNHAVPKEQIHSFVQTAYHARNLLAKTPGFENQNDPKPVLTQYLQSKAIKPEVMGALASIISDITQQIEQYGNLNQIPKESISNVRNDMYLTSETISQLKKEINRPLDSALENSLMEFKKHIDMATRFIPLWVKVTVAIALSLGTLVGWKRIVITVGEKIGKSHLTYAQGATAELVVMTTIGVADVIGLPVSTTHVLSSGVAGTMAANHSGIQWQTIRHLLMAWVLTLPMAMLLSGMLFWLFVRYL
jgi:inorganic phosphate transporter, PiT family